MIPSISDDGHRRHERPAAPHQLADGLSSAMPLTCNIDSRGKAARLIYGVLMIVAAVLTAIFWAIPAGGWLAWTVVGVLTVAGAFGIFEARAGWCAVRAMGIKTRM